MPYASKNRIAQDEFEGAIEITPLQYAEALEGLCNGLEVTVADGFNVAPAAAPVEPPAPEARPAVARPPPAVPVLLPGSRG